MADSTCEMSAEELTEALSLEEKPEASNLELKSGTAQKSQENTEDTTTTPKNPGQVAVEPNAAEQAEANAQFHNKFINKEPLDLVPYIEKYVRIQLERNYFYVGFVHSIDPITRSVILSVPKEDGKYQTVLIPGTSVLDITEVPCDSSIVPPKRRAIRELPPHDIQDRKKKILSWFKENRLLVTEDGDNIVFGAITLLPPYEEKDISSSNPLIALEIKRIIDRMPSDYQPTKKPL